LNKYKQKALWSILFIHCAGFRFSSPNYNGDKGALSMEQEQFQKLVLDKLDSHGKRFEKIEKFQDMALEYMAKMTQELVDVKGDVSLIKDDQRKMAIMLENDIKPKIDVIFEKLAIHDDEISHLKQVK
jgi:hypothetical protein